jgi:hypothetical protein
VRADSNVRLGGEFNRSTQHLLIFVGLGGERGVARPDMVHAESEGRDLGALEEWSVCGGYRPRA